MAKNRLSVDQDFPNIPTEQLRTVLDYFGISQANDEHGLQQWNLSLSTEASASETKPAVFDSKSKQWKVKANSAPNHVVPPATIQPAASQPTMHLQRADWWTGFLPKTTHNEFVINHDWASTPLGPIANWPLSLRVYTYVCLLENRATLIFWGKEKTPIYNEAIIPLFGNRHPAFLGGNIEQHWPELGEDFFSIFRQLENTGVGMALQDFPLYLERHDYAEESWWIGDLFPLRDEYGSIQGFMFTWTEMTRQFITDRRNRLINEIGKANEEVDRDVWHHIQKVFCEFPQDIAMCVLYSAEAHEHGYYGLKREATIGISDTYEAAPDHLDFEQDAQSFIPIFRKALEDRDDFIVLDTTSDDFPTEIVDGVEWQGFGEQSKSIAILPILVANDLLKGFVIIGLNPRRPMDADHKQFLSELNRQLRALLTSITTAEQTKDREERLLRDLAESEQRIRRMAEFSPMGMYDLSPEGALLWANNHFFDILGATSPEQRILKNFSWLDFIHPDDHAAAFEKMGKSLVEQIEISDSLRLRKTWCPPDILGNQAEKFKEEPSWVLYQAYPDVENGKTKSIMGCLTDISQFKWAENVQTRSAEAARAAKARQEDFIDITSHEMRNPLSAVTQCADDILDSVGDARADIGNEAVVLEQLLQIADTAKSIALCASHQRRIIDDVLTLSKLDSSLLSIVPTLFKPDAIIADLMRMFTAEFASNGIQVDVINEWPEKLNSQEDMYCDSTRLMQVLVNLITNAIKFTKAEQTREVVVRYGAAEHPPTEQKFGAEFSWSNSNRQRPDLTTDIKYGKGTPIYLHFSVQDTGQGLPGEEAVHIFDKFVQANRRTYIKYGGSGLGLFISRELIELQKGKIGVSSEVGKGSTFAFYIKAMHVSDPNTSVHSPEDHSMASPVAHTSDSQQYTRRVSSAAPGIASRTDGLDIDMAAENAATTKPSSPPKRRRTEQQQPRSTSLPTNCHVLLVEDNLVNQKILAKQLRKAGFTVDIANHGGEAVDQLLHLGGFPPEYGTAIPSAGDHVFATFDCILMDWEMPVLDGLSATRRIRDLELQGKITPKQAIVGVTANARIEQIEMALDAGMDEVVVKPFRVPALVERITAVLNGG